MENFGDAQIILLAHTKKPWFSIWMVDHSIRVIAVFNGKKDRIANTIQFAAEKELKSVRKQNQTICKKQL